MKRCVWIGLFFSSPVWAVAPVITQSTPIATQGGTVQFTETASEAGTWSCSATSSSGTTNVCNGSINSGTGLYTAPVTITPQHTYGGIQIGPNNDVYNTRIDSLPINANNTLYMNTVNIGGSPNWQNDFPINYVLPTGTTDSMNFFYTSPNNGAYEVPAFPNAMAEHGWFDAFQGLNADHHVIMVDTVSTTLSEFYQYYPNCITIAASVTGNVATLICSQNPLAHEFVVGSTVVVGGFTGADTYFNVASAILTAVTATSISYGLAHANASASTNGSAGKAWTADATGLINSTSGLKYNSMDYLLPLNNTTDAAGMELQPMILGLQELEHAVATGGTVNHAMRLTFGQAYESGTKLWPATTFAVDGGTIPFGARLRLKSSVNVSTYSATAQVLLKNLQQYGVLNSDGGNNWPMNAELTRWPKTYYDALTEIANAGSGISNNMEFIDESGIMVSTFSSLTKYNREIITFTRTSDSAQTSVDVALQGPAVNFAQDVTYIMAGTPAQQLPVLNNYGGFTCAMSPSTGTLTSGCLYTPPGILSSVQTVTVMATSSVNSNVSGIMTLTVFPSTATFLIPSKTVNYTDTHGNVWLNRMGISNMPDTQGCCSCDHQGSFSGTDVSLWNCVVGTFDGDVHMNVLVPNGAYQVIHNFGTQYPVGGQFLKFSIGNQEINYNFDPSAVAGGQYKNYTSTTTAIVTNNQLNVGLWLMNDSPGSISSLSLVRTGNLPPPPVCPLCTQGTVKMRGTIQIR